MKIITTQEEKEDKRRKIKSYKLKEETHRKKYQETLRRILEGKNNEETSIEMHWMELKEAILKAAEESCGSTKAGNSNIKRTNWWTGEVQKRIKEKKVVWKKYLSTKTPADYEEYKEKRRLVKTIVKEAKQESWRKFGQNMKDNFRDNQKLFFGTLKQLRQKKGYTMRNMKDKNGNIITDEDKIMDRWREHFQEITETDNSKVQTNKRSKEKEKGTAELTISEEEVKEAIGKLKLGKAAGIDKITPEMMKYLEEEGRTEFTKLINKVVKEKKVPKEWNTGIILPLYKKGDTRECHNYRGITLMSMPAKILARIIEARIKEQLENSLEETQYGFRKGRSTMDPTFILRQSIEKCINKNKDIHIAFIDLEKAFDRVKREDVWRSLQRYGVNSEITEVIKSMYDTTKNVVRSNNEESRDFETTDGLKQGCVLSPLLFAMVVNEAIKNAKKKMRLMTLGFWRMQRIELAELLFADDMAIVADTEKNLQHNLNELNEALININMRINIQKTKTMIIGQGNKNHDIRIKGLKIEQVMEFKYLGTIIEGNGKMVKEINNRIAKVGGIYNGLRTTFLGKREITADIKIEVIKKVVNPILLYGSETWTLTKRDKSRINATEMRFLRKIDGKSKRDRIRNEVFRNKFQIKPILITIQDRQLGWLGHIHRMKEERLTRRIYEARVQGTNRRGRPRQSWQEEVRRIAQERDIQWSEIKNLAQNRREWKRLINSTSHSLTPHGR